MPSPGLASEHNRKVARAEAKPSVLSLMRRAQRSIFSSVAAGMAARVARPLMSIVTLPFLLEYLGQEQLGIWLITLSLFIMFGFAGSGLSSSMVTAIGRATGEGEARGDGDAEIGAVIVAGYAVSLCWALAVAAVTLPLALLMDWSALFGDAVSAETMSVLFATSGALISISLVSMLPRYVMLGRGDGALAFSIETFGILLSGALLIAAINWQASLPMLLLAYFAPGLVLETIGGITYFVRANFPLRSEIGRARGHIRPLFGEGARMLGYHAAYGVSSNSDTFVIGLILGPAASAVYGIASRVFSVPILMAYAINTAQWPTFAKAFGSGQVAYVRHVFVKTAIFTTIAVLTCAALLAFFYKPILELWIDEPVVTPTGLLLAMVAWAGVATYVNFCDSVLKAKADTRFMLACALTMSAINLSLTLLLLPLVGVVGAVMGTLIGYIVAMLLPFTYRLRHTFTANDGSLSESGERGRK